MFKYMSVKFSDCFLFLFCLHLVVLNLTFASSNSSSTYFSDIVILIKVSPEGICQIC